MATLIFKLWDLFFRKEPAHTRVDQDGNEYICD